MKFYITSLILILCALLLTSCGISGKSTHVPNVNPGSNFFSTATYLSTSAPTFNIDDLVFTSPLHQEFSMVFCSNETKAYMSIAGRDGTAYYHVYQSDLVNGQWTEPTTNGLSNINNVNSHELVTYIAEDGNTMFLSSDRAGGQGQFDLYIVTKSAGVWQIPVNFGVSVNSADDDTWAILAPDDNSLYISSNRPGLGSDYDFWYIESIGGIWQTPTSGNVFARINMVNSAERTMVLADNGQTLYLSSSHGGSTSTTRIFESQWVDGVWDYPALAGFTDDSTKLNDITYISADGSTVYFSSDRLATGGDSYPDFNLWKAVK